MIWLGPETAKGGGIPGAEGWRGREAVWVAWVPLSTGKMIPRLAPYLSSVLYGDELSEGSPFLSLSHPPPAYLPLVLFPLVYRGRSRKHIWSYDTFRLSEI